MRTKIQHLNNILLPLLPETRCFAIKRFMWRLAGVYMEENVRLCSSVTIYGAGKLSIGKNTWIGPQVMICVSDSVLIGSNCDIAPRVYIGDGTHNITTSADRIANEELTLPIIIGNGCWLCANSTILAGVNIGDKCVVAAGAVVTNSFEGNKILVAGVPAKIIKSL